jgi:mRNA interferase RelE/StbE
MLIRFTLLALKQLNALDSLAKKRIKKKLSWYLAQENPLVFADKLTDSNLGDYRYRIGDYCIVFRVLKNTLVITCLGHRKNIYR